MNRIVVRVSCAAALAAAILTTPASVSAQAITRVGPLSLGGQGASIGVTVRDVTSEDATAGVSPPGGVVVLQVQTGTPAASAGFRTGDLIVEFDGERVRGSRQFARLVQETPPDRQVAATVVRDGARQTLTVTPTADGPVLSLERLDRRFDLPFQQFASPDLLRRYADALPAAGGARLGVSVIAIDAQLAEYFGVKDGVLVTSVDAGSPAAAAGVRAGDVITQAGSRRVSAPADVATAIAAAGAGGRVDLQVTREKKTLRLQATLPAPEPPSPAAERFRL
jgi:serine protease Do